MKIVNSKFEYQALRTICDTSNAKAASKMLAMVGKDSFHHEPTREAFLRLSKLVKSEGDVPTWSALCADPAISEKHRRILKSSTEKAVKSTKEVASIAKSLDKLRQIRGLYKMAETVYNKIESEQLDVDDLVDNISSELAKVRTKVDLTTSLKHTGTKNNTSEIVKGLLGGKKRKVYKTGFKPFDDKNGGLLPGSLLVVAADSGGGKSALSNQLAVNMTGFGYDVCIVPLEMTAEQMMARTLGVLSGVPVNDIQQGKLTSKERKIVAKAYTKYVKTLKESGTRYSTFAPDEDVSIEEILYTLLPYRYNVIIVDYVSLLKGADGDDQVKALGRISRFCKVFAKNNDTIIVLVAQLSEEGRVKYAQAIKENANNLWSWTAPKEFSDVSILDIDQQKARNQLRFPFQLMSINACMQIKEVDESMLEALSDEENSDGKHQEKNRQKSGKSGNHKRRKEGNKRPKAFSSQSTGSNTDEYLKDVSEGEDEDDD